MYSYTYVKNQITKMISQGITKENLIKRIAHLCMGWSYVWGAAGMQCTPANRRSYANRSACPPGESERIIQLCQVLNNKKAGCNGCKWYPDDRTLCYDCRGFTRWVLAQAGLSLEGAGATSQWNNKTNWATKGEIKDMPIDTLCCVFIRKENKMSHTGLHVGGGIIIHCSGEVKIDNISNKHWTHFAVPVGLQGEVKKMLPTIKKGSTGENVKKCQEALIKLGYDLGASGADGKFGAKTLAAVKSFQSANGLKADGVVGNATWEALGFSEGAKKEQFTVVIKHLNKAQADALSAEYAIERVKE